MAAAFKALCAVTLAVVVWLVWKHGSTCPAPNLEAFDAAVENAYASASSLDTKYHTDADEIVKGDSYLRRLVDPDTAKVKYSSLVYKSLGYDKYSAGIPVDVQYLARAKPNYVPSYPESVLLSRSGAAGGAGAPQPTAAGPKARWDAATA
jgi:hypothetical protein